MPLRSHLEKPIDGFSVGIVEASENEAYPIGTKVFLRRGVADPFFYKRAKALLALCQMPCRYPYRSGSACSAYQD